jgi:hypothetical protein
MRMRMRMLILFILTIFSSLRRACARTSACMCTRLQAHWRAIRSIRGCLCL